MSKEEKKPYPNPVGRAHAAKKNNMQEKTLKKYNEE
jgi:hypothetical protein